MSDDLDELAAQAHLREVGVEPAVLAWHWVADNRTLRDGTPVEAGRLYELPEGKTPALCRRGFHASERALDALQYAPGAVICRVELSGQIVRDPINHSDKLVASRRRVLWLADATRVLHEFACDVAEATLVAERDAGREPDQRSWDAIAVKRRWLTGEATDAQLAAAKAAARDAAEDAAWAATRDATRDATWERFNDLLEARLLALAPVVGDERDEASHD